MEGGGSGIAPRHGTTANEQVKPAIAIDIGHGERTSGEEPASECWRDIGWSTRLKSKSAERRGARISILPIGFTNQEARDAIRTVPHEWGRLVTRNCLWQRRVHPFGPTAFAVVPKDAEM